MSKIVFSGIQPSGNLHLGNYIGALSQWAKGQEDGLNIFCVVDLHAITVPQDPKVLHEKVLETAALIIAAGVDPEKSILFVQSHNPDHANLAWVLNCNLSVGQMQRMTQFKEKSEGKEGISMGLLDYPALMAADILLYDTTQVPVGDDQKQHVELARDVAQRFNSRYGETFVLPEPVIGKVGARIMSLSDPNKKMSKSDLDTSGSINLLDSPDDIRNKIAGATTDSGNEIRCSLEKPGISNLLSIYSSVANCSMQEAESKFAGKSYKEFKEAVAEAVVGVLNPLQEEYKEVRGGNLQEILEKGARAGRELSSKKLADVYERIGFVTSK